MKKFVVCILLCALLLCPLMGCGKDDSDTAVILTGGVYKLTGTTESDSEYTFTPYLKLNMSDDSFVFYFDPLSSYMAYGSFSIEDGLVVCKTSDNMFTYIFNIVNKDTVSFNASLSAPIVFIDNNLSCEITDGSVFELVG